MISASPAFADLKTKVTGGQGLGAAIHALKPDANARAAALGFRNLDFLANFGHNIGADLHARAFIDAECALRLDAVPMFTLEPHIARDGSPFAFKFEEIYRFERGRLRLL